MLRQEPPGGWVSSQRSSRTPAARRRSWRSMDSENCAWSWVTRVVASGAAGGSWRCRPWSILRMMGRLAGSTDGGASLMASEGIARGAGRENAILRLVGVGGIGCRGGEYLSGAPPCCRKMEAAPRCRGRAALYTVGRALRAGRVCDDSEKIPLPFSLAPATLPPLANLGP
jgi:hypothetical protein